MIKLNAIDMQKKPIAMLVVPVSEDAPLQTGFLTALIEKATSLSEFNGEQDEALILYHPPDTRIERALFLGLGKCKEIDREKLRVLAGNAVNTAIKKGLSDMVIAVPADGALPLDPADSVQALTEGAALANHVFDKYKKDKKYKSLKQIILAADPATVKTHAPLVRRLQTVCDGTLLAREWVSTPSNEKTPAQFCKTILARAGKTTLKATVLGPKELKEQKFGAILAVGAGSLNPPRLVCLEHAPQRSKHTIVLVGKGVTFDSGGINLKSSGSLEDMKIDMSGAAAVAATLLTAAKLKLNHRIVGVMPLVENMPSGAATRPGDIIRSYAGKTIEIGNTDAEGRLILADAMAYALKTYRPDIMIDIATLTGACVVGLGEKIAGLFTEDDPLADMLRQASDNTHERLWRMPLPHDYKALLKSDVADINNMSSSKWGGAITAALFLSEFTGKTRWAHIDIAGPASIKKEEATCGPGGTGFGVRLFLDLIERLG
jgi:leucyl aminopeptidase